MSRFRVSLGVGVLAAALSWSANATTTEFCLEGGMDLGARYQGTRPQAGERYAMTWCVITEDDGERVLFSSRGKANPDMDDDWTVAFPAADTVRIVNRESPPDIEFEGAPTGAQARRIRRLDPRRLAAEVESTDRHPDGLVVEMRDGLVSVVSMQADLPLRGRVPVEWRWDWTEPTTPRLEILLEDDVLFEAKGRWRDLLASEAESLWLATPGAAPVSVPGDRWPARVAMELVTLDDGIYLVTGVRTGFQHLVVDTAGGLVIVDAPAGWVEFHHLPPADLVPGLGVSGLSEHLIDFLDEALPGKPVRAVVVTHFHDDHAGGARAFAAAGATIYAPAPSAEFLESALNRSSMPADRLGQTRLEVVPVSTPMQLGEGPNRIRLLPMAAGPHVDAMLAVWVEKKDLLFVSDVHVPRSETGVPTGSRVPTECWFAEWATSTLPPVVRVANSHSAPLTPVSRLEGYLASGACSAGFRGSGPIERLRWVADNPTLDLVPSKAWRGGWWE